MPPAGAPLLDEVGELQAAVARMEGELAGLRFQLESARSDTRYDEVQKEAQHLQRVLHDLRQAQELAQAQAQARRLRAQGEMSRSHRQLHGLEAERRALLRELHRQQQLCSSVAAGSHEAAAGAGSWRERVERLCTRAPGGVTERDFARRQAARAREALESCERQAASHAALRMRQRRAEREASDAETAASGARRRVTEERRQSVLRREFAASEQKAAGDAQRHAASSVGAFESAREHEEEHSRITAAVEAIRGEGRAAARRSVLLRTDPTAERTAVWVDGFAAQPKAWPSASSMSDLRTRYGGASSAAAPVSLFRRRSLDELAVPSGATASGVSVAMPPALLAAASAMPVGVPVGLLHPPSGGRRRLRPLCHR